MKPILFVAHIKEEKDAAVALKRSLLAALADEVDVFVSSDRPNGDAAGNWLDDLTQALEMCAATIVLASPESVSRPWITFEAGCGFIRDIPTFVLCHAGMTPDRLPQPLSLLSAVEPGVDKTIRPMLRRIAEACGCEAAGDFDLSAAFDLSVATESPPPKLRRA